MLLPEKSAIANRQSAMSGWLADPGCSLSTKSNSDKFWATPPGLSERASTGVAGHVFNTPFMPLRKPLIPPFPHFDPFGTEFCEPGRVSHPDPNRQLQRSFQLSPEFLTSTRESGFNRSNTYIERYCYLFVREPFNIS